MRQLLLIFTYLIFCLQLHAQEIVKISRNDAEAMFLQNNLLLMAEKLQIESKQAEVIQARLWPNPEFSISEVNLWRTTGVEPSPPLFGSFGKDQQFAFEISQLIQTAGKRKKLISLEELDVSKAEQYLEDLLRHLKLELRTQLTNLQFIQQAIEVHQNLIDHISQLTHAYKNQLNNGNISKAQYIRLKAQKLEIEREVLALERNSNEIQKELKLLLRTDPNITLQITDDGFVQNTQPYRTTFIEQLIDKAKETRPDYKLALLEQEYANNLLDYEKAQRIPDLTFGVSYDRNGSTMLDFVGVGVSFDLPIFNRNKGNIKKAEINIKNTEIQKNQAILSIENEIHLAYKSLQQAIDFLDKIEENHETDLDLLLQNYTHNFTERNVNMLEYFDFMNAYLNNKTIILNAHKEVNQKIEELNYSLGKDLIEL